MSTQQAFPASAGGHADHNDHSGHGHDDSLHADHGTFKSYVTGFVLAVLLTAIPFWLVLGKVIDKSSTTALVILGIAAVQIVVHMIYFLHMNTRSEGGWTMLALIFTVMMVVIMLSGSIWVMYHLNHNMMPGMNMDTIHESVQPQTESVSPGIQMQGVQMQGIPTQGVPTPAAPMQGMGPQPMPAHAMPDMPDMSGMPAMPAVKK